MYCKLMVLSDLLNQAFSVHLCENSHRNSATIHIAHIPYQLQKRYKKSKFYVGSLCGVNLYQSVKQFGTRSGQTFVQS